MLFIIPYSRKFLLVQNFRGIACQPFRRNFRGFNFRVTERAPRHSMVYVRCLFKISRFLFLRRSTDPRKTRNFAPSVNFPLYGNMQLWQIYINPAVQYKADDTSEGSPHMMIIIFLVINPLHMRSRVTVVCLSVCVCVCLLPFYLLHC